MDIFDSAILNTALMKKRTLLILLPGLFFFLKVSAQISCNNWLRIPNYNTTDYVSIGDLDMTGNKITVEALFAADTNYFIPSTISYDLVSKHTGPSDCNYLLRPVTAEITTTDGFYQIISCDYKPRKINHAALVYDGSTLKFYRNGFLMGSKPASGNLITNDLITKIGNYSFGSLNGSLKGYMNEVRIWNVARTKDEIKTYMNNPLPNPTSLPGLVAYYQFDNLSNKQGNTAWNGTLSGAASINNLIPDCNFVADSCITITQQQTCNGSFGNPVVNITFGSGTTNPGPQLPTAVPGATTNYNFANYATGTPPSAPIDGDYALINQVPVNSAWYTGARDHTGNANGYMAFFNSSPTPGDFYRQTVNNLCPGTTYEFSAWVANVINPSILPTAILPNITFKILDPVTSTELATFNTGDIPNENSLVWKQYSFLFTMPAGNSSVTLVLSNNNIGGNAQPGNDLAIDDITFKPCGPLTNASFSSTTQVDSTGISNCNSVNVFGNITGSFNSPSYQWQISSDGGTTFTNVTGAAALNATVSNLSNGQYIIRLLSAEAGNINSLNCRFISNLIKLTVNGCNVVPGIKGIINDYTAVTNINVCTNRITVEDASTFNVGDTVVIMQMKGATLTDTANTNNFGRIFFYNNTGGYEFNYIKSKTGQQIELQNAFLNDYNTAAGSVQLIRVPYFQTVTVADTLTCPAWNGKTGGVVILTSATDVILNAPVDVSTKGFRGGVIGGGFSCSNIDAWAVAAPVGGNKGESIAEYLLGKEAGGACLATGGGGAYAANSGGGGGANYGGGGNGGLHSNTCPSTTQSIGGQARNYGLPIALNMGSGGGGGQQDNGQPVAAGGNGGGIVILKAATLTCNTNRIIANGQNVTTLVRDEGGAGGGAGGSVFLFVNNYTDSLLVEAMGGYGSSNDNQIYPTRCHGPGGGGGGGYVGCNAPVQPLLVRTILDGGKAGKVLNPSSACYNTTNGAVDGENGGFVFNIPFIDFGLPFKKNIDSVRINETLTACKTFDFRGAAYTNTNSIQQWEWDFGDGAADDVQNTSHTYTLSGPHTVKLIVTDINGCRDSISKVVNTNGINFDFVFEQDICNPLLVHFKAVGDSTPEIFWSGGNGIITTNIRSPTFIYPGMGSYLVEYCTGNATTGCIDTVKKTIFVGWVNDNIIITPDTTVCFGDSKLLRSNIDSTLGFCWSPASFLNSANLANPTTSTPSTITYSLSAKSEEGNLVVNGNFNNGNTSFSSDYDSSVAPLSIAEYFVGISSLNAGPLTANCTDHTTGSGNMLVARCDFSSTSQVWAQKVTVLPNTNYTYSAWVQSLINPNTALLQLSINGNVVQDDITTFDPTCEWVQHAIQWNSGNSTTADLAIVHKSLLPGLGGYFAIDDISLSSYSIKRDTVKINVDTPFIDTRSDTTICQSASVQFNTIGAVSYSWIPATGLSNASIANPVATPVDTTKYIVTGTNAFGCIAKDSLTVFVKTKPLITSTGDTSICFNTPVQLFASGGVSYSWEPVALLNNAVIANPIASAATDTTKYIVIVTGANNCIAKDSFIVSVNPLPVFTVSENQSVCLDKQAQLNATGGNYYLWSPPALVNNPGVSNPLSVASNTTLYSVLIKDTLCGYDTTLATRVIILPLPEVTAGKENDINCAIGTSQLSAAGALQYSWVPAASLNNASIATPVASPVNSTTYTVTGTDAGGCSNTATVTVLADYRNGASYIMPNAFSPNGDQINDCFRPKYFGLIKELRLSVYNRWGQRVFFTTNPDDCWDGTYKGVPCDPGNFVYFLTAKTTCGNVERKGNVILVR